MRKKPENWSCKELWVRPVAVTCGSDWACSDGCSLSYPKRASSPCVRIGSLPAPALRWQKVPYTLRIKAGSRVTYKGHSRPVQQLFRHLGKPCPNRFGCGGNPPT